MIEDGLHRIARRIEFFEKWIADAHDASNKVATFCATTGLTQAHLTVAHVIGGDAEESKTMLKWAMQNEATPSEMICWHRLQQSG